MDQHDRVPTLPANLAGVYSCSSADAGPQHDQLCHRCRQLNIQDFQALSHALYGLWRKSNKHGAARQEMARVFAVANFRRLLAEQILDQGGKLLAESSTIAPGEVEAFIEAALTRILHLNARSLAALPAPFAPHLKDAIARGVQLVRDLTRAEPAGELFFPQAGLAPPGQGAVFDPAFQEPLAGCPSTWPMRVRLTVFPGYQAGPQGVVLEKALVYTISADETAES